MSWLIAAIEGDLGKAVEAEVRGARRVVTAGIREATEGLKAELRGQVVRAGVGTRLARSRRGRVYPNEDIDATGTVWSNRDTTEPRPSPALRGACAGQAWDLGAPGLPCGEPTLLDATQALRGVRR